VRVSTLVILMIATGASFAQTSTTSSGDYTRDLGQVYGGIRRAKMMEEICSKEFSATHESNRRAYEEWRKRYLSFAQEMERHYSAMTLREANNDPGQHKAVQDRFERGFDGYRDGLKQRLAADGLASFRKKCEGYPAYLRSPRMNLEAYYSEQVATIRRGPK
jgi:hypothetical protein